MEVDDVKSAQARWIDEVARRIRMVAAGVLMGVAAGFIWDKPGAAWAIFYGALFVTAALYVMLAVWYPGRPSDVVLPRDVVPEDPDHEVHDDGEAGAEQ